jgi:hypothetical protein
MLLEDPRCEERIMQDWGTVLPSVLQEWRVSASHVSAFSDGYRNASLIRDRVHILTASDEGTHFLMSPLRFLHEDGVIVAGCMQLQHAWTHRNQLYTGIYEALRSCAYPWYVASSKAPHRVSTLMWSLLGIEMETTSPRLFAGLIPPNERKIEALRYVSVLLMSIICFGMLDMSEVLCATAH